MGVTTLADKTTLDKIDTDITTLKSRGGFKASSDGFYGYDVTNDAWQKVNFGELSGANPTLVVINDGMTMTGKPVTVSNNFYSKTQVMRGSFDIFALPKLGAYNVTWDSGTKTRTRQVNVDKLGGVSIPVMCYPTFNDASWYQINALLTKAYADTNFDLSDIWAPGDTRSVTFTEASGYGFVPTQAAGTRDIVILDFDYDTLTTPVEIGTETITKARITLALKDKLPSGCFYQDNKTPGWEGTPNFRSFCNNGFYNSMPSELKTLVKPVQKSGVSDYCSFISVAEYNGTDNYEYLKDSANRSFLYNCWTRDSYYRYSRYWYYINGSGGISETSGTFNIPMQPIFSI